MNALKNKVQLIGYLGGAPEIREMENGKKLARMNLATHETYKNAQGEKVTETHWHQVIAWGKLAEVAEKLLDKGTEIAIDGKLQSRTFTDKEGVRRYITEVCALELLVLEGKKV